MPETPWPLASYEEWLHRLAALAPGERATLVGQISTLSSPDSLHSAIELALALALEGDLAAAREVAHELTALALPYPETHLTLTLTRARMHLAGLSPDAEQLGIALAALDEAEQLATDYDLPHKRAAIAGYRGLIARLQGDYPGALAHFDQALAAVSADVAPEEVATLWNNYGLTQLELGLEEAAATSLQKALQIFKPLGKIRHLASVAQNIGFIYLQLERYDEAYQYTGKALEWYRQLPDRMQNHCLTCTNMGAICIALGRLDEAAAALATAAELCEGLGNPNAAQYLRINQGALAEERAEAATTSGDTAQAQSWYQEAETHYTAALRIAETHGLTQRIWRAHLRLGLLAAAPGTPGKPHVAWPHLEIARTGFREQHRTLAGEAERRSFLTQQRGLYGALIRTALAEPLADPALAWSLAQEAKQSGWITGLTGEFPQEPLPSLPYAAHLGMELLNVLWENDVLDSQTGLVDFFDTGHEIYRFAYKPDRGLQLRSLSLSGTQIGSLLDAWQEQLRQFEQTPLNQQRVVSAEAAGWLQPLSRVLLEGVEEHFGPLCSLLISPHGLLMGVPWMALLDDTGTPVIARQSIALVPYWAHLEPPNWRPHPAPTGPRALILGGTAPDLPFSQQEVAAVQAHLGAIPMVAGELDRPAIADALQSVSLWHFAGHGRFDATDPASSYLESGSLRLPIADFLSGELRGPQLDLVTLAACEAARLQAGAASMVEGFLRALLATGTRSMLAGAWKVRDDFTARFMEVCYGALLEHGNLPAAVQQGMQTLRAETGLTHPYFWAGYQPWGLPTVPVAAWHAAQTTSHIAYDDDGQEAGAHHA